MSASLAAPGALSLQVPMRDRPEPADGSRGPGLDLAPGGSCPVPARTTPRQIGRQASLTAWEMAVMGRKQLGYKREILALYTTYL